MSEHRVSFSIDAVRGNLREDLVTFQVPADHADYRSARPAAPASERCAQPYSYRRRELVEPDWERLPGWRGVTRTDWESAQWQRVHCVKTIAQLRAVWGDLVPESFYVDLARDHADNGTMPLLLPPQIFDARHRVSAVCHGMGKGDRRGNLGERLGGF